jgi:hypothetical protein
MLAVATVSATAQQGSGSAGEPAGDARPPTSGPVYRPPLRGAPAARVGGATRDTGADATVVRVVAPDHVGLTARAQPVLYWFVSRDVMHPVEITVVDHVRIEPLLRVRIDAPVSSGIHTVSLAEHGVRLETGRDYQWFVAILLDPERRASDTVAGGYVRRVEAAPTPAGDAAALAERGLWYDAYDAATRATQRPGVGRSESDGPLGLLEQAGLSEVAAFKRASGG